MRRIAVVLVAVVFTLLAWSNAQAHVAYVAYDPCCPPPVVVTACCASAPAVVYHPTAVVRTRCRPLLGGTVTRVRYRSAPVVYFPGWWW